MQSHCLWFMLSVLFTTTIICESDAEMTNDEDEPYWHYQKHQYDLIGCFADAGDRDLDNAFFSNPTASVAYCASVCKGFSYFGMQFSSQCFCGHQFGRYGRLPNSECKTPCAGAANENCGGTWRNSIYHYRGTPEFLGCFVDRDDRDLSDKFESSQGMNVNLCQQICRGYEYFGLQYGNQCFCGNSFGKYGGPAPMTECNMRCAGNNKDICGGFWRNSVYHNRVPKFFRLS